MDPITAIAAANAALALAETLIPKIQEWAKNGDVTPEQEASVRARLLSLRARAGGEFSGPEWQV
jgi:hypothetical protein